MPVKCYDKATILSSVNDDNSLWLYLRCYWLDRKSFIAMFSTGLSILIHYHIAFYAMLRTGRTN